jgi:hypothetical protein
MPGRAEVWSGLYGAYRLAFFDPSGMKYFNLTIEGFWRSFFAAALVAPGYALLMMLRTTPEENVDLGALVVVESVAYAIAWCAFPVAAIALTRLLGLGRNYVALVVAINWSAVLQTAGFVVVVLLGTIAPGTFGGWLVLLATGAILAYQWFVIRTALETTGGVALMLLLVDLLLTSAVNMAADGLL